MIEEGPASEAIANALIQEGPASEAIAPALTAAPPATGAGGGGVTVPLAGGSAARRLLARLAPLDRRDPVNDAVLLALVTAIAQPRQIADDLARDSDTHTAWTPALDPDAAPADLLDWLAPFAGTRLPPSAGEQDKRDRIRQAAGFYRSTTSAIVEEVRRTLVSSDPSRPPIVRVVERPDGTQWTITIVTRAAETPQPAVSRAAAARHKRAGAILTFVVSDAPLIDEAARTWDQATATWDQAKLADVT